MKSTKRKLDNLSKSSNRKLITLITVGSTLLVISVVTALIDPILIVARYKLRLANGTVLFELLSKEMAGAMIEAYIFNVTNAARFMSGEDYKLKVEEIGPFTYQELRSHNDLFIDEEAGTMRYSPHIYTRFHANQSVADPNKVNVNVPNIPFLALASKISAYPIWTQLGLNILANRLDSQPVINLTVHDFLWGYNDPLIALGNTLIPGMINFEKLGLLDRLYDQKAQYDLVLGVSNAEKFRIKTVNGAGGLRMWDYDNPSKRTRCNTFVDTYEGLAYPPGLTPDTPLRVYRNVFCRIIDLQYDGTRDMEYGPKAFVYHFSNKSFQKGPQTECLCGRLGCMDGLTDLSPCFYDFEVYLSQAHFLDVNPHLYERVEGIYPNFEKHGSEFLLDPKIGSVLTTTFTLQLNVVVKDVNFNPRAKPFSNSVVPVLYFKIIQPELPDEAKEIFKTIYFVMPYVCLGIDAVIFLIGVVMLTYAARLIYWNRLSSREGMSFTVTKMERKDGKQVPACIEEPLIERDVKFTADIITNCTVEKTLS